VDDTRAAQIDFDARRHFTTDGEPIHESRQVLDKLAVPDSATGVRASPSGTASSLTLAAEQGLLEVG